MLSFETFEYDEKSPLNKEQQVAAVVLKNLAIHFRNLVDERGNRKIPFLDDEEIITLADLAYTFYKASSDVDAINVFMQFCNENFGDETLPKPQETKLPDFSDAKAAQYNLYSLYANNMVVEQTRKIMQDFKDADL